MGCGSSSGVKVRVDLASGLGLASLGEILIFGCVAAVGDMCEALQLSGGHGVCS